MIEIHNQRADSIDSFDLLVCAVGYESRSSFIARKYAQRAKVKLGFVFPNGRFFSFEDNRAFFSAVGGCEFGFNDSIVNLLKERAVATDFRGKNILLDVSSLNRAAMAKIFAELLDEEFFEGANIYVAYALARFESPSSDDLDFLDFGPIEGFAGWTRHPERPSVLLMGLGYEADHAVGAFEYLDPSATYCFAPRGVDPRFEKVLRSQNEGIFRLVREERVHWYNLLSPYQIFWELRSLTYALLPNARIVMVPMGPKLFCSLCFVCQRIFGDEVSVWRASGHTLEGARDAFAEGTISSYLVCRP